MKKQSVAAACMTALLLLTTACGKAEAPVLPVPQEEQMKAICQLAVLECDYHNLAKFEQKDASKFLWMTKDKRFWVEYSATAVLGIDVKQVSMDLEGNVVKVTLPKAEVLDCNVNGDSLSPDSYIVDKDSAPVTAEDEVAAFQEAQDGLQKTVEADNNMMNLAQTRVEDLLRNYVNSLAKATGTEYQVEFHYIEEDETA